MSSQVAMRTDTVCTFWLGGKHYGLDVSLVGEVVALESVLPVPASPKQVLGLFNLRGNAVALLDLDDVLGFPPSSVPPPMALVLRTPDGLVAFGVERMDAVVPKGRGEWMAAGPEDHPAVAAFMTLERGVATVLDARVLLERVEQLRFFDEEGAVGG